MLHKSWVGHSASKTLWQRRREAQQWRYLTLTPHLSLDRLTRNSYSEHGMRQVLIFLSSAMACLASALPYGMDKIQVGGSYVEFFVGGFTQSPLRSW